MKRLLLLFLVLLPFPAHAADPTIIDACKRAAEHYWNTPVSTVTDVQSFPELSPPRVRMRVATERVIETSAIAKLLNGDSSDTVYSRNEGEIRCEFSQAQPPFGLSSFCPPEGCFFMPSSHLEELQVLLKRDGL